VSYKSTVQSFPVCLLFANVLTTWRKLLRHDHLRYNNIKEVNVFVYDVYSASANLKKLKLNFRFFLMTKPLSRGRNQGIITQGKIANRISFNKNNLHFLSTEFLKDSQIGKRRLAVEKFQAALRIRETTICLANATSTHLFTIMCVALSSDLLSCAPHCELYSS